MKTNGKNLDQRFQQIFRERLLAQKTYPYSREREAAEDTLRRLCEVQHQLADYAQ